MRWPTVVLFAAAAGIYTGAVMLVPFLKETSFQDIGVAYEWWVVFAVIVVVNCRRSWEAMLKCFAFFLISQPLVYLVEVLFGGLALGKAWYYYRAIWLPMTFLTLPGGWIAYFCKKQNLLGGIILGLGNTIQAVAYSEMAARSFPHHLLSALFCVGSVGVMTLCIQKKKAPRIAAVAVPAVLTAALLVTVKLTARVLV